MMQSQQIPMTFQRYETKYMLSPIMARKLRKSLPGHLQMDEYGLDTICSLYYDTPDHQLIRRSLEKPVYKEKLRLRSYGPAKETSPIYVELKKKYEGNRLQTPRAHDIIRSGSLSCGKIRTGL